MSKTLQRSYALCSQPRAWKEVGAAAMHPRLLLDKVVLHGGGLVASVWPKSGAAPGLENAVRAQKSGQTPKVACTHSTDQGRRHKCSTAAQRAEGGDGALAWTRTWARVYALTKGWGMATEK
jgi:hypothetical protein